MRYLKNIIINFFLWAEYIIFYKKFESFLQKESNKNFQKLKDLHGESFEDLKKFVQNDSNLDDFDEKFYFDLTLQTQTVIKDQKLSFLHGYLLEQELRKYLKKNSLERNINILEIGTARGYSSICMAKVLEDYRINGKILSIDILPVNKKIYWNCLNDISFDKQTRYELLKPWESLVNKYLIYINGYSRLILRKFFIPRIHFCFIDGSHQYDDVFYEINFVKDRQKKNDIIFFDDFNLKKFPGVLKAINDKFFQNEYYHHILDYGEDRKYLIAIKK